MPLPIRLPAATLAAAALALAPPAAGQSNLEQVVNGALTPSHDYDLIHQRIEVKNFDWDSTAFDGRVTTTVASLRPGLETVVLDMERRMEVRAVTSAGKALAYDRPPDSLVVRLARPARFRDTLRFTVDERASSDIELTRLASRGASAEVLAQEVIADLRSQLPSEL